MQRDTNFQQEKKAFEMFFFVFNFLTIGFACLDSQAIRIKKRSDIFWFGSFVLRLFFPYLDRAHKDVCVCGYLYTSVLIVCWCWKNRSVTANNKNQLIKPHLIEVTWRLLENQLTAPFFICMNLNCDIVHRSMNRITMDLHLLWQKCVVNNETDLKRRTTFHKYNTLFCPVNTKLKRATACVGSPTMFFFFFFSSFLLSSQQGNRKLSHFFQLVFHITHIAKYFLAAIFCVMAFFIFFLVMFFFFVFLSLEQSKCKKRI